AAAPPRSLAAAAGGPLYPGTPYSRGRSAVERSGSLAPKTSTGDGTVKCPALFLPVNRGLRVLGGPGEPLDLDAVHPGEPRTSFERSAGDVPVQTEPLIDERRRLLLPIDAEDPPGVTLQPGRPEGLPERRRAPGRAVPEHQARLAIDRLVHDAGLLQRVERVRPRLLPVPDAQDHRVGGQPPVGRPGALAGILVHLGRQVHGFVLVVHRKSDRLRVPFLPEPPITHQSWLGLKPGSLPGAFKSNARQAGIEGAVRALHYHDAVPP